MGSIDMPQIRFRRGTLGTRRRRTFAGLAGMLGLGLGLVAGCVLYVDEDAIGACSDVSCGANAFCDVGDCYCFTGYGGDPDGNCDPEQRWLVRDACDDATDVEFRLFSTSRDWVWPSEGVYATAGLEVDTALDVLCTRGETVCFGGQAGGLEWGVGLDGTDACDGCCFECEAGTVADMGLLTCP